MDFFNDPNVQSLLKTIIAGALVWYLKKDNNVLSKDEFKMYVESKDKNDILIRDIADKDRRHIDSKLENFIQEFKGYKSDMLGHFNVKIKDRKTILIYDDDPISIEIMRGKLERCDSSISFRIAKTFESAIYELKITKLDCIFADLKHRNEDFGILLYDQHQLHRPEIKFILYSAGPKPVDFPGDFVDKNIKIEELKKLL